MKKTIGGIFITLGIMLAIPAAGVVILLLMLSSLAGGASGAACVPGGDGAKTVTIAGVPKDPIAGWKHEQLVNAAHIIIAAKAKNLDSRAQVIGVMTAMGESSLINIGYGDWETSGVRNPDGSRTTSIGLFQQQNGWGSTADRMDPEKAAGLFFARLITVQGWQSLEPTIAAHRVQRNADPRHYEKYFTDATKVVSTLTGLPLQPSADAGTCAIGSDGNFPPATGKAPGPWGGHSNGRIPVDQLGYVPWDNRHRLRTDALAALKNLNTAFKAQFGYDLPINDGYRSYQQQVEAKWKYGKEAATPGTSNHGWALAIDIGDQRHYRIGYDSAIFAWLKANAPAYGWVHPPWAAKGSPAGPDEAWHWEFWGKAS